MEVKKQRLHILQERILQNGLRIGESMVGTEQDILVVGPAAKTPQEMSGRTENNRVVNFAGSADLIGQLVTVKITEARRSSLSGCLISK